MPKVSGQKRVATLMLAAAMSAGTMGLAACAQTPPADQTQSAKQEQAEKLPSAAELIESIQKQNTEFNGRMTGNMSINMAIPTDADADAGNQVTIDAAFEFDVMSDKAHGTMSIPMAALTGESGQDMKAEMYVENDPSSGNATTYMTYDGTSWTKTSMPIGQSMSDTPKTLTDALTDEGTKVERNGDGYRLVLDAEATRRLSQGVPNTTGMSGDMSQLPVSTSSTATVDVDKDMKLQAIHIETETDDVTSQENANALSGLTMGMTLDMSFSDNGKITDADVTVPETVRSTATEGLSTTLEGTDATTKDEQPTNAAPTTETTSDATAGIATGATAGATAGANAVTESDMTK